MFFKNICNWSNKTLYSMYIAWAFLFFDLVLVAPVAIIAWRYGLFKEVGSYKLSGAGLCCAIIVGVVVTVVLRKILDALPEERHWQQCVKFGIMGVIGCIIPCVFAWILVLLKSNFELGYSTAWTCIIFIVAGILVYWWVLKFFETEIKLRREASKNVETRKRERFYQ